MAKRKHKISWESFQTYYSPPEFARWAFILIADFFSASIDVGNLRCLRVGESETQKILEQNPSVARFIWVLPPRRVLVPVFERFFQMELDGIDQLMITTLDHHLVPAKI